MPDLYRTCCQKASDLCCLEDNKGKAMYWEGNNFLLPCILFTFAPKTPIEAPYDSFLFWRLEGQCLPDGYIQLVLLSHYFLHSIIILVFTVFAPTVLSQFKPSPVLGHHPRLPLSFGFWVVFYMAFEFGLRLVTSWLSKMTTFKWWSYQFLPPLVEWVTAWHDTLSTSTLNIYPRWTHQWCVVCRSGKRK